MSVKMSSKINGWFNVADIPGVSTLKCCHHHHLSAIYGFHPEKIMFIPVGGASDFTY